MLLLCYAGLQLEAAKRIVTTARREKLGCRSYKRVSWEVAQSISSPDTWLFREEVAERKGASAKRSFSEEVAQSRKVARPSIHSFIHPFVHWFIDSLTHGFMDLPIHWFIGSLNR